MYVQPIAVMTDSQELARAQDLLQRLREAQARNLGVSRIVVDGFTVEYDRAQLQAEIMALEKRVASLAGGRTFSRSISLRRVMP